MKDFFVRMVISMMLAAIGMWILGITGGWTVKVSLKRLTALILIELAGAVLAVSI